MAGHLAPQPSVGRRPAPHHQLHSHTSPGPTLDCRHRTHKPLPPPPAGRRDTWRRPTHFWPGLHSTNPVVRPAAPRTRCGTVVRRRRRVHAPKKKVRPTAHGNSCHLHSGRAACFWSEPARPRRGGGPYAAPTTVIKRPEKESESPNTPTKCDILSIVVCTSRTPTS